MQIPSPEPQKMLVKTNFFFQYIHHRVCRQVGRELEFVQIKNK